MAGAIVIDCATVGPWVQGGRPSQQEGRCVRVAYIAMNGRHAYEAGCLVTTAPDWPAPRAADTARGGILSAEALLRERITGEACRAHLFWRRFAAADLVIGHGLDFHLSALARLVLDAGAAELCLWRRGRRRFDTMEQARPVLQLPGDIVGDFKPPTLAEAFNLFRAPATEPLEIYRSRALEDAAAPIRKFGLVQVRAAELVWAGLIGNAGEAPQPEDLSQWET